MFTIAGMARRADVPRRVVQFWADKGAIVPEKTEEDSPRLFSLKELRIARLLAQLHATGASIAAIKLFAGVIRVTLGDVEHGLGGNTGDAVHKAMSGQPAWLLVAFPSDGGEERPQTPGVITTSFTEFQGHSGWDWVYRFTGDPGEVGALVLAMSAAYPKRAVVVFNLTAALHYEPPGSISTDE